MSPTDNAAGSRPSAPKKKPYAPPRLVSRSGHVKDIVQGGGGKTTKELWRSQGFREFKSCWIAEALYGVDDARTLLLRAWLSVAYDERRPGWQLIALYRRYGRTTADLIYRGYLPRGLFRPLFNVLVDKALDESAQTLIAYR